MAKDLKIPKLIVPKTELVRGLSLTAAIMISAGSMIGSGIFRKPSTMAGQLMSPELLLIVWIVAGVITFIGALSNAEVAGMIDATGGQYAYFRKMYGDFTGFLYGWSIFSVIQTGSQAAIAYVFGEYLGYFIKYPEVSKAMHDFSVYMPMVGNIFPFQDFGPKAAAIICILFLTTINYIGVIFGGLVQSIITMIKIASILLLAFLLITIGDGSMSNVLTGFAVPDSTMTNLFPLLGLALAGAFWAYDGWNNVTFVAGEVKNPQHNIPRALMFGTLITMGVYIIINIAYLYVLPVDEMAKSPLVAASAADKIFGNQGAAIISIAVIISTFGALNGSILATARVQFAMAQDKLFFKGLGRIHPRFGTPHISLIVQGIWSCILVMSGSFDTITDYVIFAAWTFYALGAAGVIILRKKMPRTYRPYKVWGYPYTTIIFVLFSFFFLLNSVISDTEDAAMGTILILTGIPIYFYWKYRDRIIKKINENGK
ncbi:MAG TPA: amino acid permease [Ignavibacteriaceae bacterium]|nr:amino acid permease [Ignavibacteriaceae bacterium]